MQILLWGDFIGKTNFAVRPQYANLSTTKNRNVGYLSIPLGFLNVMQVKNVMLLKRAHMLQCLVVDPDVFPSYL